MNQPTGQITLYQTEDGKAALEVRMEQDSAWLRQEQMSELFGRERSVITKHLRNIFVEGELEADSVCANFAHTAELDENATAKDFLAVQTDAAIVEKSNMQKMHIAHADTYLTMA